jgi:uncharacterized surface protein with fasciclin (FAS1) repeats
MTQDSLTKRNLTGLALLLVIGLGPLAALSIGSHYASKETLMRAEAGDRNYEKPERYPDWSYGLPNLVGAAAGTTVLDVTRGSALFDNFNHALSKAKFKDVLRGPGPVTVFVPTDDAFEKLSPQQRQALFNDQNRLTDFLSNHVVRGKLAATDLLRRDQVQTLGGKIVPVGGTGDAAIGFGDANIVQSDLAAGNGVVHFVDSVTL